MRELCSKYPIKVTLSDISEEHRGGVIDSYIGVTAKLTAHSTKTDYSIFEEENKYADENYQDKYNLLHSSIDEERFETVSVIEERSDYVYFKIDDISFEAKELVGQFFLYCGRDKIAMCKSKNDALENAEAYIKEASSYF
ncbi:MAG: hypothetical protein KU38_07900 [Sulfurovum sp. FS08-3]|nr:MAG: hypothetical protein KU38_07900 [Sulfurovum sp. FS08-3]